MPPFLVLVRHAEAAGRPVAGADLDRPLTAAGAEAARGLGMALAGLLPQGALAWSSPARRCLETARLVTLSLPGRPVVEVCPELGESAGVAAVSGLLQGTGRDREPWPPPAVLAVSHQPLLAALLEALRPALADDLDGRVGTGAAGLPLRPGTAVGLRRAGSERYLVVLLRHP